jgi:serine/threonine protein kinase
MLLKLDELTVVTSWTNGQKAVVHLMRDRSGAKLIAKVYRPGFFAAMLREYVAAKYVASMLSIVPRVLGFHPWRKEIYFSYIAGQRVLEWVLQRFGHNVILVDFQSFHGIDPPHHVHPQVVDAFARFRRSTSEESLRLKAAIAASYSSLHRIGILHGSADPRNVIYDGEKVFIIDFDHARPSFNPEKIESTSLAYWYGSPPSTHADSTCYRSASARP